MIVVEHFTRPVYGVPVGQPRRVKPVALACLHITGNRGTAAATDLHAAAQGERNYANGHPGGPSASHYIARDGWTIEAIDWKRYAAWSNGVVVAPNVANAGIRRLLALKAKGYGANEGYWIETESVGYPRSYPVNEAQKQANAELIAAAARYSGLPINRETVHGHFDIDSLDRNGCPDIHHEAFLADVIAKAQALIGGPVDQFNAPVGSVLTVPAGTVLFDNAGMATSNGNTTITGAPLPRNLRLLGLFADQTRLVAYKPVGASVDHSYWVDKAVGTVLSAPPTDCTAAVTAAIAQTKASAKVVFG